MGSKDKKSKEEGKKKKKKEESDQEEDDDDSQKKKKKSKKGTVDSDDGGKKDKGKKKKKSKTVDYVEIYESELRNYEPDKVENYEDEYHKKKGKTLYQRSLPNISLNIFNLNILQMLINMLKGQFT